MFTNVSLSVASGNIEGLEETKLSVSLGASHQVLITPYCIVTHFHGSLADINPQTILIVDSALRFLDSALQTFDCLNDNL